GFRAILGGMLHHDPEMKQAGQTIESMAKQDPAVERMLGVFKNKTTYGETRYYLARSGAQSVPKFNTGERFNRPEYMRAAGAELRRFALADELNAFQAGNLDATYVLTHNISRKLWHSAQKINPDLTAEDFAALQAVRFQEIQAAAAAKGVDHVWERAQNIIRENRGKGDDALGEFISKNQIDFPVHSPKV